MAFPGTVEEHRQLAEELGQEVRGKEVLGLGSDGKVGRNMRTWKKQEFVFQVVLRNSGPLTGLGLEEGREAVLKQAKEEGWGGHRSSPHLQVLLKE